MSPDAVVFLAEDSIGPKLPGLPDLSALGPLVGDSNAVVARGVGFLGCGVQLPLSEMGVLASCSLEGVLGMALVGEVVGVELRRGEGDEGDSGRRKGDVRGEP